MALHSSKKCGKFPITLIVIKCNHCSQGNKMELYWQRNGITGKFPMTIKGFIVIKWDCNN